MRRGNSCFPLFNLHSGKILGKKLKREIYITLKKKKKKLSKALLQHQCCPWQSCALSGFKGAIPDPVTASFSDIITRAMDMVALTNSKPTPKDPKIIKSLGQWETESRSREVVWVSAPQRCCTGSDPQQDTGRNPFTRAKQTPTLLIMIIINYQD